MNLKNRILRKVELDADGIDIYISGELQSNEGEKELYRQSYYPDGDCCSRSFIVHVDEPIYGGEILSDDLVELAIEPYEEYYSCEAEENDEVDSCVSQYFYNLPTTKGNLTIEMRNYSNGWYGGTLKKGISAVISTHSKKGIEEINILKTLLNELKTNDLFKIENIINEIILLIKDNRASTAFKYFCNDIGINVDDFIDIFHRLTETKIQSYIEDFIKNSEE